MRADKVQQGRIDRGRCGNCGSRPPKPGCTDCLKCLSRKSLTLMDLRDHRKSRGLCYECGRKKLPDRWGCRKCMDRRIATNKRHRAKRKAEEQNHDER